MNYATFREQVRTGDLLLVEGAGLGSILIRAVTAQQVSHVALVVAIGDGLWVAEMQLSGYTLTPASQRVAEMQEHGQVYWGKAPEAMRWQQSIIVDAVLGFRGHRYSYWTLVTVWFAQLLRRRMPRAMVCSTLVEQVWSAAGIVFAKTPDPGDFFLLCDAITPLQIDAKE